MDDVISFMYLSFDYVDTVDFCYVESGKKLRYQKHTSFYEIVCNKL